jgi:hypothetical protein
VGSRAMGGAMGSHRRPTLAQPRAAICAGADIGASGWAIGRSRTGSGGRAPPWTLSCGGLVDETRAAPGTPGPWCRARRGVVGATPILDRSPSARALERGLPTRSVAGTTRSGPWPWLEARSTTQPDGKTPRSVAAPTDDDRSRARGAPPDGEWHGSVAGPTTPQGPDRQRSIGATAPARHRVTHRAGGRMCPEAAAGTRSGAGAGDQVDTSTSSGCAPAGHAGRHP